MSSFHCPAPGSFVRQSLFAYIISVYLITANPPTYVIEYVKIIKTRSSRGISWFTIFLAAIALSCNILTVIIRNWELFHCCSSLGAGPCISRLLPMMQIGGGWLCTCILFTLCVCFAPRRVLLPPLEDGNQEENSKENQQIQNPTDEKRKLLVSKKVTPLTETRFGASRSKSMWIIYFGWILVSLLIFPAITAILFYKKGWNSDAVQIHWSWTLGIIAITAILLQWLPQMYETWKRKDPGNLSLWFLGPQWTGCFIVVFSLWYQNHEPWHIWGSYAMEGVQSFIVFWQCAYYLWKRKKGSKIQEKEALQSEDIPINK